MDKEVRLKLIFGFVLLGMLFILAISIALGKVEAQTSYGLLPVITTLSTIGGAFSNWAFRQLKGEPNVPKENEERKEGEKT